MSPIELFWPAKNDKYEEWECPLAEKCIPHLSVRHTHTHTKSIKGRVNNVSELQIFKTQELRVVTFGGCRFPFRKQVAILIFYNFFNIYFECFICYKYI